MLETKMKDLPEESEMFKERLATLETKDETTDPFVPARETKMGEDYLVRVEL